MDLLTEPPLNLTPKSLSLFMRPASGASLRISLTFMAKAGKESLSIFSIDLCVSDTEQLRAAKAGTSWVARGCKVTVSPHCQRAATM